MPRITQKIMNALQAAFDDAASRNEDQRLIDRLDAAICQARRLNDKAKEATCPK
jgi:hypothetical protein